MRGAPVLAVVLASSLWLSWSAASGQGTSSNTAAEAGDADHGRLIFNAGDCASCHASPGQDDPSRLGGGIALASPFGTFRAPNISSHPVDGIGAWRTDDLARALLQGLRPDGKPYYPVLPYTSYSHMTYSDVRDLRAYLRSLPAVAGRSLPHELSFPFNIRSGVRIWRAAYFRPGPLADVPGRDDEWHRGRYLAEAIAHCAECHSSRNAFGAIREETRFAGGPNPEGIGFAPNITPERLKSWTKADLVRLLTDGHAPNGRSVGGAMVDVVTNTAKLPPQDRQAIAAFVLTLPARPTPKP